MPSSAAGKAATSVASAIVFFVDKAENLHERIDPQILL
jgi:hypothetical protein